MRSHAEICSDVHGVPNMAMPTFSLEALYHIHVLHINVSLQMTIKKGSTPPPEDVR